MTLLSRLSDLQLGDQGRSPPGKVFFKKMGVEKVGVFLCVFFFVSEGARGLKGVS